MLISFIATDPGAITKTERELRWLSIALVVLMALADISQVILGLVIARAVNVFT